LNLPYLSASKNKPVEMSTYVWNNIAKPFMSRREFQSMEIGIDELSVQFDAFLESKKRQSDTWNTSVQRLLVTENLGTKGRWIYSISTKILKGIRGVLITIIDKNYQSDDFTEVLRILSVIMNKPENLQLIEKVDAKSIQNRKKTKSLGESIAGIFRI